MCRLWLVVLFACGARAEPTLPIEWAPSFRGLDLVLSADGDTIAVVDHRYNAATAQTDELVRVHEHDAGERMLGEGYGTLVGAPARRDALIVDPTNTLQWVVAKRSLPLPLDQRFRWVFAGGAADHTAKRAQLVFVPYAHPAHDLSAGHERKLRIVAVDTAAMQVVGTRDVALDGRALRDPGQRFGQPDPATGRDAEAAEWIFEPGCTVTGSTELFLTCRTSVGPDDPWAITRYDNLAPAWSTIVRFVDDRRGETTFSCLAGDGNTVALAWGSSRRGTLQLFQNAIVDTRTGATRFVHRSGMSGYLYRLVPYPSHAAVAELYLSFTAVVMLDTSRAVATKLVEWPDDIADKLSGVGIALRADGTFVVGSHDPKYRPR